MTFKDKSIKDRRWSSAYYDRNESDLLVLHSNNNRIASRCGIGEIRLSIELNFASHTKDMYYDKLSRSPSYKNVG